VNDGAHASEQCGIGGTGQVGDAVFDSGHAFPWSRFASGDATDGMSTFVEDSHEGPSQEPRPTSDQETTPR
jgi:hypothetical protein